jgi:hypothetical protein
MVVDVVLERDDIDRVTVEEALIEMARDNITGSQNSTGGARTKCKFSLLKNDLLNARPARQESAPAKIALGLLESKRA